MTKRIRMARKRLMIARERRESTYKAMRSSAGDYRWLRWVRRLEEYRAIERRKDRIA